MAASAYIDPVVDPSGPVTAADIETVARRPAGRLGRDRVRKRRYAKGFPHPLERELWFARAWPTGQRAQAARSTRVGRLNAYDPGSFSLWI